MRLIYSNLFGEIAAPQNLSELLQVISIHAGDRNNVYLWRGQANIDWAIHSSAYRRLAKTKEIIKERDICYYEEYLLRQATHQGYRLENGRELSDFELLAKLQHHGAATRLIDCSRNLLVALWFCCSIELQKTGLIFGIHTDHIGGSERSNETRKYKEVCSTLEKYDHPQSWQPPIVTKRISSQSAHFLYSKVSDSPMGSLAIEQDEEVYIAIAIEHSIKQKLLKELEGTFDISYLSLFPDIDGFGYAHSFRHEQFQNERW